MDLFLRPEAVADLRATRAYYEEAEAGLSRRLGASLDELFARLQAFARSAPPVAGYEDVRRAVVREFPFVVFYRLGPDGIDIAGLTRHSIRRRSAARPRGLKASRRAP